jgi:alpha-glucosidase
VLIAEHNHDATGDLTGDGWQGTMNYAGFTRPAWSWLTSSSNGLGFLGMPVGVPRRTGLQTMLTMRDFAASVPWKVACRNWNLLSSHDTPRIRTVTGDRAMVKIGVGLQMTYIDGYRCDVAGFVDPGYCRAVRGETRGGSGGGGRWLHRLLPAGPGPVASRRVESGDPDGGDRCTAGGGGRRLGRQRRPRGDAWPR